MKSRSLIGLAVVCAWTLSVVLAAVAIAVLPKYIASVGIAFPVIALAMLVCVVIFILGNVIYMRKFIGRYNSPDNVATLVIESNQRLDKAKENYLEAEKDVFRCIRRITFYKVLITLYLIVALLFFIVGLDKRNPMYPVSLIFACTVSWIYALPILDFDDNSRNGNPEFYRLKKEDYPLLFATVEQARKTLNCATPFKLYAVANDGISVSSSKGLFNIFIDIEEFAILTRDELYQIMLHEIAHVINNDTKKSLRLEKFSSKSDTFVGKLVSYLFLSKCLFDFELKKVIYYQASSKFCEQKADCAIRDYGNAQQHIDATAKTMLLSMYNQGYKPEMNFYIYKEELPPDDYYAQNLALFDKYLQKYGERWNYVLTHRIESRADTHPTFAKRMGVAGVSSYDYTRRETDLSYKEEQNKLLKWGCDQLKRANESYKHEREDYLSCIEKLEKYRKLRDSKSDFSSEGKVEYIDLLYNVDRDECLLVCNEVLIDFPQSAYANFYKGLILAERLDSGCIECLYIAAEENFNFSEYAIHVIGEFACNVGDAQLLENYRSRIEDDLRSMLNRQFDAKLRKSDNLRLNGLPEKDFKKVLDFILCKGFDIVEKIYSVSRGQGEQMRTFYYLEVSKGTKIQEADNLFNEVFDFLDQYGDGDGNVYDFALYGPNDEKKLIRLLKKVDGSMIYCKQSTKDAS